MRTLLALPLFLLLCAIACGATILPAALALALEDHHDARSFFYSGIIGLILTAFVGLAMAGQRHNASAQRQLLSLLAVFLLLPLALAVPFYEAVRTTTFLNAYLEMVSALTTTGATLFEPARLSEAEHLWRALVGWLGGLLMWIAAAAILAPLALGGFEITASGEPGQAITSGGARTAASDPAHRLARAAHGLIPTYAGLTLLLWILLLVAGDTPFVALCHAMAVLATSGISPVGGVGASASGLPGEMLLLCFMVFALSRLTFSSDTAGLGRARLVDDPELRVGLAIVLGATGILFLRHFVAAFEVGGEQDLLLGLRALWGTLFTVMSFLTTTGFESASWDTARDWSGLSAPGLILMGLAVFGGGVATTAGGVKLLRVFALYLNGAREIERLVHPSSIGQARGSWRRLGREGAFIAWVFFMLFAITLAALTTAFALLGQPFEQAMLLAVAGLTNTGPLLTAAGEAPLRLLPAPAEVKLLFAVAMVLGRLELLAIIAMLTPDAWRD